MVAMATRVTSNGSRMNNSTTVDNPGMGRRGRGGGGGEEGEGGEEKGERRGGKRECRLRTRMETIEIISKERKEYHYGLVLS